MMYILVFDCRIFISIFVLLRSFWFAGTHDLRYLCVGNSNSARLPGQHVRILYISAFSKVCVVCSIETFNDIRFFFIKFIYYSLIANCLVESV